AGERLAAYRQRSGAIRVAAFGARAGVPVDDLDDLRVHPKLVGDDLGERRFLALAVGRSPRVSGDRPGVVDAHHRGLPEAGLVAESLRADNSGWGEPADLGVRGEPDPAVDPLRPELLLLTAQRVHV